MGEGEGWRRKKVGREEAGRMVDQHGRASCDPAGTAQARI